MRHLGRWVLAVLTIITALVAAPAAPASADYGCPGTRDSWRPYLDSTGTTAAVRQTYRTADGLCINLVAKNRYAEVPKYMRLRVCDTTRENCKTDAGIFERYAGPIYWSDGNCVSVRSSMRDPATGEWVMDHWTFTGACN